MASKTLPLQPVSTRSIRPSEREIEVPAGCHRFVIKQRDGERHHTFHLREAGSEVLIIGLVRAADAAPSLETTVVHHTPHTRAETRVKTLATGMAEPRYRGVIRIEPGSHGCESYLNHDSLLIGDKAQSWTTPSLEILNNEVKCSHAATIRTITKEELFYLESRGLNPAEAETILIDAFLANVPR